MSSHQEFVALKRPLDKILKATHNFDDENLIGQGGFGKVYKGNLLVAGKPTDIAARRLHYDYGQGDLEFWNEISMLASLKHKHDNLVSFIGFCDEGGEKIIINKHEVNGSLDKYLSNPDLTWMQRLQICVDVAHTLNYIHCGDGHESSVIHRNIKSSKILLDENWKPKLSGFEHSKTNSRARRHRLVLTEIVGTIGYVDPTYEKTGFVTHKSDVYSFGVVLFEVLCGRRAFVFPDERESHSPQYYTEQDHKDSRPQSRPQPVFVESGHQPTVTQPSNEGSFITSFDSSYDYSSESSLEISIVRSPTQVSIVQPPPQISIVRPPPHVYRGPLLFSDEQPRSFVDGHPTSFASDYGQSSSFGADIQTPRYMPTPNKVHADAPVQAEVSPIKSYSVKEQRFILQPLFTMKRVDRYLHSPNEELLAELVKSHYDEENLDDIIDPALRKQMHPKSFKIFSKTAYNCLNEKRVRRPNIDQILRNLQKALKVHMRHENPEDSLVACEDEGTAPNRREDINRHLKLFFNLFRGGHLEHLKIPFIDIKKATKAFTEENYLGSGGYAKVYKAELEVPIEEKTKGVFSRKLRNVAIKCIREDMKGNQGFDAEIELLTSCKHTNIISLYGFCDEGSNLILVYEHASNGSLDSYLESQDNSTNLTWVQRIKIGIDIAHGLNYIHTRMEDEQRIVHRDIKSANILLARNWVAKIADFGLSRFHGADLEEKSVRTRNVAGTEYYVCPEYAENGRLKTAVDIYSFGVVLFEILFGKLAYDPIYVAEDKIGIAYVARQCYKDRTIHEMVDTKIMEEVDELTSTLHKGPNQDALKTYSEIAHRCLAITQDARPTAKEILEELEKALSFQENNKDNLQISFEEIKSATKNFSRENLIGGGGFGKVFKGEFTRGNGSITLVAKRLDRSQGQGEHHFLTELEILFEYKHENIIGLEGYCNENNEKIIVYEHACNGSLDRHLNDVNLTWSKRLKICIDIARGLAFLHGGAPTKEMVIHRDIKSANILLNSDWKAKISDFGLSAIIPRNEKVVSKLVGTIGYVDPQYEFTGFFTEKSDIYSLGVLLFEILYGQLLVPNTKDYDQESVSRILKQIHEEDKLLLIVFDDMKERIDPQSLSIFRVIVSKCLYVDRSKRPTAEHVLQQLEISLELQEDYEIWGPKLPEDYEEILKLSKSPGISNSTEKKKDLYNLFSKGILLKDDKVWFSLGSNGERIEMLSARKFSYRKQSPHKWCIVSESRFGKVAEMLDISNLMIKIKTMPQFLSPNTIYGVYLVFKFCDSGNLSSNPMYANLKYRKEKETLHAYFAKWRDDGWMMIELYRFLNDKEDGVFKFLLHNLSPYYCREHDVIYVEGIEFRAIDNVQHDETEKSKENQQVMKSISNVDQELQLPIENEEMFKKSENCDQQEKLFSLSEVNSTKHLMLSAKAALCNISDLKLYKSKPSSDSRFQEVLELLPQPIFRISCKIKSQMLSHDTDYACYLVFKLSENFRGLHCPVEVRDLLQKNRAVEIVYFKLPRPWNIHDITRVPEERKDGWMEVNIWKFNSTRELKNDCILVNLKLISYEGTISGLIVCGLEFRPIVARQSQKKLYAEQVAVQLGQHKVVNNSKTVYLTTDVTNSSGKAKAGRKRSSSMIVENQDKKKVCRE